MLVQLKDRQHNFKFNNMMVILLPIRTTLNIKIFQTNSMVLDILRNDHILQMTRIYHLRKLANKVIMIYETTYNYDSITQ